MAILDYEFMGEPAFHSVTEEWLENTIHQYIETPFFPIPQEIYDYVSPLRKLLLEWYPFREKSRILEIGGNMGELTGYLCDKGDSVISIEHNIMRANIIRFRCRNYKNLEVKDVSYKDIQNLGKFDYIIIHNSFGYLKKYFSSSNIYVDFLKLLFNTLDSGGTILLAVNNRIGMKYLSGAVEELTKKLYTGINGFDGYERVRTFSKSELSILFKEAGINNYKFYYPFPNYIFPTEIHTSESLRYFYYDGDFFSTDYEMPELFNLKSFSRTLQKESCVEVLANSFLVEISKGKLSDILYYKPYLEETSHKSGCLIYSSNTGQAFLQNIDTTKEIDIYRNINLEKAFKFEDISVNISLGACGILPSLLRLKEKMQQTADTCIFTGCTDNLCQEICTYWERIAKGIRKLKNIDYQNNQEYTKNFNNLSFLIDQIYLSDDDTIFIFWPVEIFNYINQDTDFVIWKLVYDWYSKYIISNRSYRKHIPISKIYVSCNINDKALDIFDKKLQEINNTLSDWKELSSHFCMKYDIGLLEPARVLSLGTPILETAQVNQQLSRRQETLLYEDDLLKTIRN